MSLLDLKQTLLYFKRDVWRGQENKITTILLSIYRTFSGGGYLLRNKHDSDYRITKGTGWLEILGCGMVDPNVLETVESTLKIQ